MNLTLAFVFGLCVVLSPLWATAGRLSRDGRPCEFDGAQESSPPSPTQQPTPDNKPAETPAQESKPQEPAPEKPSENQAQPPPNPASDQPASSTPPSVQETQPKQEAKPAAIKPHPKKKKRARSGKVVVRDGGTSEPTSQLSPQMSPEQAHRSQQTTSQLLLSTDANLKRATARVLTESQLALVEQIKKFVEQSNAAVKAGDYQRGHNLAIKALLLSDDLMKQP